MNAKNNRYLITVGFSLCIAAMIIITVIWYTVINRMSGPDAAIVGIFGGMKLNMVFAEVVGSAAAIGLVVWILLLSRKRIFRFENRLQKEKDQLHRAIESMAEGVIALDMNQNVILFNSAAERLTGWTQKEVCGKPFSDNFAFSDVHSGKKAKDILEERFTALKESPDEKHYLLTAKDGTIRYVADNSSWIKDMEGNLLGIVLTFRDETEQKKMEETMNESKNRAKLSLENILSPKDNIGGMQLQDILNISEIESMMMDFYRSTNVPASVIDSDNKIIISTGFQDICTKFHLANPQSKKNCMLSDSQYTSKLKMGEYKLYKCFNNMWDMTTPIIVNGQYLGNVCIGQFLMEDEDIDYDVFRMQAQKYGYDEKEYLLALEKAPRLSREKLESAMSFYVKFAGMLSTLSYCNYQLANLLMQAENTKLLLKSSIENSREMLMVSIDKECNILFFNNTFKQYIEELYDQTVELGANIKKIILSGGESELLREGLHKAFKGESSYFIEEMGKTRHKNLEIFINPIYNNRDEVAGASAFSRDISDRLQMEKELAASEARNKSMLSSISDVVAILDEKGRCSYISPNIKERFGWIPPKEDSLVTLKTIHPQDRRRVIMEFNRLLEKPEAKTTMEVRYLSSGKSFGTIELTGVNRIHDPNINGVLVNFHDISERKKKEEEIIYLYEHNALTGIYNRRYFDKQIKMLDTPENLPLSIIYGDIDGLKLINDALGHTEGDRLIIKIANILKKCVRKDDIPARMGGDEFGILLPRTTNEEAYEIVKRINMMCREQKARKDVYYISISMGYATKTSVDQYLSSKIKEAEDNMYKKKLLEHKSLHSSLITSIKTTMLEKSFHTEEHAERLVLLSNALGRTLGLTNEQIDDLELLSTLHDIGKIVVDDSILHKGGELTAEEWEQMKKHPDVGYRIAMASPELVSIAEYILCHHERWDGSGYPQGLSGEEIPLLSRIIAVTDSYDAMTQDRPYRKAMSRMDAIGEIRKNAGRQFDPKIAEIFVEDILLKEEFS